MLSHFVGEVNNAHTIIIVVLRYILLAGRVCLHSAQLQISKLVNAKPAYRNEEFESQSGQKPRDLRSSLSVATPERSFV